MDMMSYGQVYYAISVHNYINFVVMDSYDGFLAGFIDEWDMA